MQLECVMTWTASSERVRYHSKSWLAHKRRPGVLALVVLNIATWGWAAISAQSLFSVTAPPHLHLHPQASAPSAVFSTLLSWHHKAATWRSCARRSKNKKEKKKKTQTLVKLDDGLHPLWAEFDMRTNWRFPKRAQRIDAPQQGKKDTWEWKSDSVPRLVLRGATICLWFHSSPD